MYDMSYTTIKDINQAERWFKSFKDMDKSARDHGLSLSRTILKPIVYPKLLLLDLHETFYLHHQCEIDVWQVDYKSGAYRDLPVLFWTGEYVLTWKDSGDRDVYNVVQISWDDFIKKAKK